MTKKITPAEYKAFAESELWENDLGRVSSSPEADNNALIAKFWYVFRSGETPADFFDENELPKYLAWKAKQ